MVFPEPPSTKTIAIRVNIDARLAAVQSLLSIGQATAIRTVLQEAENHPEARIRARAAAIQERMEEQADADGNDQ